MKKTFLPLLLLCALLIFACSKQAIRPKYAKPLVLVSVSPYDEFVRRIAGSTVEVKAAVPANFNAHLFEATPKQIAGFEHAVLWMGVGEPFEKNLVQALQSYNKNLKTIDLGNLPHLHQYASDASTHSCSHDHGHHDDEGIDKHFYSSPHLALEQARLILAALEKAFPHHAKLYKTNFSILEKEFQDLIASTHQLLAPCKGKAIIISHPSLGYFCHDYHLLQLALECEGKTPLPEDLVSTLSFAKTHKVLCVFGLEQFDNKGALAISNHLQLPLYIINLNDPDYFNNILHIAKLIATNNHD